MDKSNFTYPITIGWLTPDQSWTVMLADIVDQFGLPGGRYTAHPTTEAMFFKFKTEEDLLLFKLKWSEYEL